RGRLRPAVDRGDAHQDVIRGGLGILDGDVEVAILREYPRVEQLELRLGSATPRILLHQPLVGECRLWILVEELHVGMRRRRVEIEIVFLDVLAVIALWSGEAEEALLEDGVVPVPQRQREAEPLVVVRDASDTVLAPAIDARARVVMGE